MFWLTFLKYSFYVVIGIILLALCFLAYLLWFQPAFYFPKPTGSYAVGSKLYHWIDTTRKETLHNDAAHSYRELMVKVWYPAKGELTKKPSNPYDPTLNRYMKTNQKSLWLMYGFSRPLITYAIQGLPLATDQLKFPVIIFSHGNAGTQESNTAHCEELASHGYIVIGISHTYDSLVVQFPDGRIADGMQSMVERAKQSLKNQNSLEEDQDKGLAIWVDDVHFVIDQLEQLDHDKQSLFYQRIDKDHIGYFGHSTGGSTAILACRQDTRIKAAADLEGPLTGLEATKPFNKPLLFLLSGNWTDVLEGPWTETDWKKFGLRSREEANIFRSQYRPKINQLTQATGHDIYTFIIRGASHGDFNDTTLLKEASLCLRIMKRSDLAHDLELQIGSINGFRATEIVDAYLVNFFDKYLKGKPSDLLDGKDKNYEEVARRQ